MEKLTRAELKKKLEFDSKIISLDNDIENLRKSRSMVVDYFEIKFFVILIIICLVLMLYVSIN